MNKHWFLKIGFTLAVFMLLSACGDRVPEKGELARPAVRTPGKPPIALEIEGRLGYAARLADGRLLLVTGDCRPREKWDDLSITQPIYGRFSSDEAATWSDSQLLFHLPGPGFLHMVLPLGTRDGAIHLVGFDISQYSPPVDWSKPTADIWHTVSRDGGKSWETPQNIDWGHRYTGALNSIIELKSGRILVVFSYLDETRERGFFVSDAIYSDDGGKTWHQSKNDVPVDSGGKGVESGAAEPVVVELADGRVWMVIRTQAGYLFESYSRDGGETWSPAQRTIFRASNAPAGVLRLKDGRLVLIWNNEIGEPFMHGISYSRLSLVMAIQDENGWHGYREVAPPFGPEDKAAAHYPFLVELSDGDILVGYGDWGRASRPRKRKDECTTLWNGDTRFLRVDPQWLLETEAREDFSQGIKNLQTMETAGVQVISGPEGKPALRLQKPKTDQSSGATWNFPFEQTGSLKMRLRVEPGFQGAYFALSEYFLRPSNRQGGTFRWMIGPDRKLKGQYANEGPYQEAHPKHFAEPKTSVEAETTHELTVKWDCETRLATVYIDGEYGTTLLGLEPARGVAYLRMSLTQTGTDAKGIWVMRLQSQSERIQ